MDKDGEQPQKGLLEEEFGADELFLSKIHKR